MTLEGALTNPDLPSSFPSVGLLSSVLLLILMLLALELVSVHAVHGKSAQQRQQYLR